MLETERFVRCFTAVFPELTEDEIRRASNTSVANWDSLATVTLISVIEEEFEVVVPIDEFESIASFELVVDCVTRLTTNGS